MIVAKNIKGEWIYANQSKEKAYCPICKTELVLAIYTNEVDRFRHKPNTGCTYGQNQINDWHIEWQSLFKNTEINYPELGLRADVVFKNGLILELQNSSIAWTELRNRESKYKKMVWLFNLTNEKHYKNTLLKNGLFRWEYPDKHWLMFTKPSFFQIEDDLIIDFRNIQLHHAENAGGYSMLVLKSEYKSWTKNEFIDLLTVLDNLKLKEFQISQHYNL
jgi:competence CoiA-like predicted nuclease